MRVAVMMGQKCVNIVTAPDTETIENLIGVDGYKAYELPDGYGIGDTYNGLKWAKGKKTDEDSVTEAAASTTVQALSTAAETTEQPTKVASSDVVKIVSAMKAAGVIPCKEADEIILRYTGDN